MIRTSNFILFYFILFYFILFFLGIVAKPMMGMTNHQSGGGSG
jgi:hypothetical protein